MFDLALIVIGLLGLWLGTELVIKAAINIAQHYRLSELFVGLTILSIGSDLPELAVAVDAGVRSLAGMDTSGTVVGTSIGSDFGQIGFVLGIAGLVSFLWVARRYIYRQGAVLLGSIVLLAIVGWDEQVTRTEGFVLIITYLVYFSMLSISERRQTDSQQQIAAHLPYTWLSLIVGMIIVIFSSDLTVYNAVNLADELGVSQATIAILIIGPGTSLPELVISLNALLKNKHHLSVGNIIGSNIFDTLVPIGVAAAITPVYFEPELLLVDLSLLFLLTLLVLSFFLFRKGIHKPEAMIILTCYALYIGLVVARFT